MTEARLRNEAGEITDNTINHTKGTCCPSSASSFPEDCVRLKLSSARASQAGLKEMMVQMKNERISEQWSKETTCTARASLDYTWREITDFAISYELAYD